MRFSRRSQRSSLCSSVVRPSLRVPASNIGLLEPQSERFAGQAQFARNLRTRFPARTRQPDCLGTKLRGLRRHMPRHPNTSSGPSPQAYRCPPNRVNSTLRYTRTASPSEQLPFKARVVIPSLRRLCWIAVIRKGVERGCLICRSIDFSPIPSGVGVALLFGNFQRAWLCLSSTKHRRTSRALARWRRSAQSRHPACAAGAGLSLQGSV